MADTSKILTTDAEIAAAIAAGKSARFHTAVSAVYDRKADEIAIRLKSGVGVRIPRKLLQGLESATPEQLEVIEIEGPGTGLAWPKIDVAHYVPSLVDGVFGTRKWMAKLTAEAAD